MAEVSKGTKITLQPKNLQCKNLHEYLKTLPTEILDRLYNHPTTCLAVFRWVCVVFEHSHTSSRFSL
jgi:transcription initiation factor TFIIH subunit 4